MRKGRAFFEFMMVYGWGILVALAMIGAMWYFGVFTHHEPTAAIYETSYGPLTCSFCSQGSCGVYLSGCEGNVTYMCLTNVKTQGGYPCSR
jgi:hypothetical protein